MKKINMVVFLLLAAPTLAHSLETAESIIQKVDDNRVFGTEKFKASMVINRGQQVLTKEFYGYGQRTGNKSFIEFTNAEDKGVKYLKLENELWIYFPDADDVLKISGHMLRQGMMGSDISYEDMLENDKLEEKYRVKLLPDKSVQDRVCYVVELTAKKPDLAYEREVLYVDQEKFVALELELYARGGRLLKTMSQEDVQKVQGRWLAMKIIIRDTRKRDSQTTVQFEELQFDQPVPEGVFTKGFLKR